jgi:hypothetical protein
MRRSTRTYFIIAALAFPVAGACGPGTGSAGQPSASGTGGSGTGATGNGASPGVGGGSMIAGGGTGTGSGGDGIVVTGLGGADAGASSGACGITLKPEQIIKPVGIFIMQDRSGSMVTGYPPPASPDSWNNSTAAVTAFVNDPSSDGISVGLGSFPALGSAPPDCSSGTNCGTPIVPIAALPGNASPMITAMQTTAKPDNPIANTPTECGIRGMISQCQQWQTANGITCVNLLVTDGTPTECNTNDANLVALVANAKAQGFSTFVIGLPGSNLQALNQLAQAGGTNAAIDVSAGVTAFVDALNKIRATVATALPCQWKIPPPPPGQTFDPQKVNISFTPKGGAAQDFGYVAQADCPRATNAWYFDDPNKPKEVLLCSQTCDLLKASAGAEVTVGFGCQRKNAPLR